MSSAVQFGQVGSSEVRTQRVAGAAASANAGLAAIVWVSHSSMKFAADLVSSLRGLDLDAKLWDESHAGGRANATCDIVVADPAGLRMIARCVSRSGAPSRAAVAEPWRGGLAPGVLRRVVAEIESRLAEKIETAELAALAGLSECHFSRAFGQSVGMPPHRYVMTRRIAVGAGLVERTERAFTDIALSVGFSDHSHFTRMFVRMTGETPRAYRRRTR
jgi:transcriptional regulator GlxA family with amidase domain